MLEAHQQRFLEQLLNERNTFVARHQEVLLQALPPERLAETAVA